MKATCLVTLVLKDQCVTPVGSGDDLQKRQGGLKIEVRKRFTHEKVAKAVWGRGIICDL